MKAGKHGMLLYLTGRGIGHHATWARIIGMLISAALALTASASWS